VSTLVIDPAYEIAYLIDEHMVVTDMGEKQIDLRSGHNPNSGGTPPTKR
jgi:hypothetical protein